ncbi:MAG: plastocyanin/azurin family copper-binding protein, partial [Halobaculum sp.]
TVAPQGALKFDPADFTIQAGETVRWEWQASGHNVAVESQPSGADWPGHADQLYGSGHTYEYTFEVEGTYDYFCEPHKDFGMVGSFTVE